MSNLSLRDTMRALLADVERTVIELDKTRTQTALESYQSAKELLLDPMEVTHAIPHPAHARRTRPRGRRRQSPDDRVPLGTRRRHRHHRPRPRPDLRQRRRPCRRDPVHDGHRSNDQQRLAARRPVRSGPGHDRGRGRRRRSPRPDRRSAPPRRAGASAGRDAAAWWEQGNLGGRTIGDTQARATTILHGLDDIDPAVLDALPTAPVDIEGVYEDASPLGAPVWTALQPAHREALGAVFRDVFDATLTEQILRTCLNTIINQP